MDECPVCLEPLDGTIVTLGCCHNRLHVQCYVDKCPLCRAQLPVPTHVAIPVPVPVPVVHVRAPPPGKFSHIPPVLGTLLGIGLVIALCIR